VNTATDDGMAVGYEMPSASATNAADQLGGMGASSAMTQNSGMIVGISAGAAGEF
jgi:hypothetical protein